MLPEDSVLYSEYMLLSTTKDLFFLVASVSLLGVSAMLMWVLYEWARLGKQANELVQESRKKLSLIEGVIDELLERVQSISTMIGSISTVVESVLGFVGRRSRRSTLRSEVERLREELDAYDE